jgi:hypothetical protein
MRDFRDAKAMAQTLRDAFTAKGVSLTHSESLELIARILGFHDWNELAARIQSERKLRQSRRRTDQFHHGRERAGDIFDTASKWPRYADAAHRCRDGATD